MDTEYRITKEECQKQIDGNQNICSQCGGTLTPIDTVDNGGSPTFWIGCEPCGRFDHGVKFNIHMIAEELVINRHYRAYHHDTEPDKTKEPERYKYWQQTQIGGIADQVNEIVRMWKKLEA